VSIVLINDDVYLSKRLQIVLSACLTLIYRLSQKGMTTRHRIPRSMMHNYDTSDMRIKIIVVHAYIYVFIYPQ
jgi:predicted transcriptional regulator